MRKDNPSTLVTVERKIQMALYFYFKVSKYVEGEVLVDSSGSPGVPATQIVPDVWPIVPVMSSTLKNYN